MRKLHPEAAQDDLNLQAARAIDQDVVDCINARRSFAVETVLSSPKYRDDILTAKANGFKFGLIYVSLHPPELSPQRVQERVAKGGMLFEAETAIKRHARSHKELSWFAPQADILIVFDNSNPDAAPVLVASRSNGRPLKHLAPGINPAVDAALADMLPKPKRLKPSAPSAT